MPSAGEDGLRRRSISVDLTSNLAASYPPDQRVLLNGVALVDEEDEEADEAEMGRNDGRGRYGAPSLQQSQAKQQQTSSIFKRRNLLLALGAVVGLVWLAGGTPGWKKGFVRSSSHTTSELPELIDNEGGADSNTGFDGLGSQENLERPNLPEGANAGSDSSATTECIPIPGKPAHQYALMIDAGSTGSHIHI